MRTRRMALTSAALIRGLLHIDLGSAARHVGHVLLCRLTQSLKQSRQKLCWQGACGGEEALVSSRAAAAINASCAAVAHRHRLVARVLANGALERLVQDGLRGGHRPRGATAWW